MKKINNKKQKELLTEMLVYIDEICKKNKIKYSLIGGSLIGAIRHQGFIPWDDDIDIILSHDDYIKLIDILENQNGRYKVMDINNNKSYYYPYSKLVDTNTILKEKSYRKIDNYGLFIDIFEYNKIPNDKKIQKKIYKKVQFYKKLIGGFAYTKKVSSHKVLNFCRYIIANIIGKKRLINKYNKIIRKYNSMDCNYIMASWPVYSYEKEIQEKDILDNIIKANFENKEVMIYKKFDKILKTTFGDYMKLPPKEDRIAKHELEVYIK